MPRPSPAYYPALMGRRYHGGPSGCLPVSSSRRRSSSRWRWCRHRAAAQRAELLAFLHHYRASDRVGQIRQRLTIALHRHFFRSRFVRRGVVPRHIQHRFWRRAASSAYIFRRRKKIPARISPSVVAIPGASAPFQCHCSQRPELTIFQSVTWILINHLIITS